MAEDHMDIAIKKLELIEWLSRLQDARILARIDALRKANVADLYNATMPDSKDTLDRKLERSDNDISAGVVATQKEVEDHFRSKVQL